MAWFVRGPGPEAGRWRLGHPGFEDGDKRRRIDIELRCQTHHREVSSVVAGVVHHEGVLNRAERAAGEAWITRERFRAARERRPVGGAGGHGRRCRKLPAGSSEPRSHQGHHGHHRHDEHGGRERAEEATSPASPGREGRDSLGEPSYGARIPLRPFVEHGSELVFEWIAHRRSSAANAARSRSIA